MSLRRRVFLCLSRTYTGTVVPGTMIVEEALETINRSADACQEASAAAIALLQSRFPEQVSTARPVREQHAQDTSYLTLKSADAVFFARSEADVVALIEICRQTGTPIIPYGVGTSLEGHTSAPHGGICLDLSGMSAIVEIDAENMLAVVEPGCTRKTLNAALRDTGLFFPVDPGADATLGGMAATRASGTTTVRYGSMRENVVAAKVALADGSVISVGTRAAKSSAGYDLAKLFVGSAGTLGIFTEVTLKLHPVPERIAAAVTGFETTHAAVQAATAIRQAGIAIARIEFLDATAMRAANLHSGLGKPEQPTLFLEFNGAPKAVDEEIEVAAAIIEDCGGTPLEWALQQEDRDRLWQARHDQVHASPRLRPGCKALITDVCVPVSELAANIDAAAADLDASFLMGKITGHVGDGNFHVSYLVMPDAQDEIKEAKRLAARMVERAIASRGTCTGEHGIGVAKLHYMEQEHGPALQVMRAIKHALDPAGILNPGKVLPERT